jgi:hypothetical protein
VDARGERQRGKELRVIGRAAGRFAHTVREGERLDLLAFKYYGDPTRWWQIADANPEEPYPPHLLDSRPLVAERMVLAYATFATRYGELFGALALFGEATPLENLSESPPASPPFLESTAVVAYDGSSAKRDRIIAAIEEHEFNLLAAYGRADAGVTKEAFTFDDRAAKADWRALVGELERAAGVIGVRSSSFESALEVVYNAEAVERAEIVALVRARGFELESASSVSTRAGSQIVIPPNQAV